VQFPRIGTAGPTPREPQFSRVDLLDRLAHRYIVHQPTSASSRVSSTGAKEEHDIAPMGLKATRASLKGWACDFRYEDHVE
jgi:hypothetical protein